MRKRKVYDDDDGRVIANMNFDDPSHEKPQLPQVDNGERQMNFTRKERFALCRYVLTAALLIAFVFIAVYFVVIYGMILIWS